MMQRFASAASVAAIVVGIGGLIVSAGNMPDPDGAYLLVRVWCVLPLIWGLWAMLIPSGWIPARIPHWGASLGLVAGLAAAFMFDLPARVLGMPGTLGANLALVALAVVLYGLLWMLVRQVYGTLHGVGEG